MKNPIFRFSLIASLILILVSSIPWLIWKTEMDYDWAEVLGYTSMLAAMSMVFFGVRNYRDVQNKGMLTFKEGMRIGLLIALIPSLAFGLYSILFYEVWGTEFMESYYNHTMSKGGEQLSLEAFQAKFQEMKAETPWMFSTLFQGFLMFITVFIIGTVVTVISAVVLKNEGGDLADKVGSVGAS